jgi:excinuclease ABC subunit A
MAIDRITVRGARQHNLKDINVEIPRDRLTVITGLSGSGKSSLAFDTIYAEGQRRYVESLSAYARQFLDQLERPDVDSVRRPLARHFHRTEDRLTQPALDGRHGDGSLRLPALLFSSIGQPHCHICGAAITARASNRSCIASSLCPKASA